MELKLIEAIDFFGMGGYIDMDSQQYLPPGSMSIGQELMPNDDSVKLVSMHEYLVAPVIRSTYISYMAARQLGVSHDLLVTLGFTVDQYQDAFYPLVNASSLRKDGYSDAEWAVIESVDDYMREIGQYKVYLGKKLELRHALIINWLSEHGVKVL